jgi:hypothetical protein
MLSLDGVLLKHFICVALQVVGQRLKRNLQIVVERAFKSLSVIKGGPACPEVAHIVHVSAGIRKSAKVHEDQRRKSGVWLSTIRTRTCKKLREGAHGSQLSR